MENVLTIDLGQAYDRFKLDSEDIHIHFKRKENNQYFNSSLDRVPYLTHGAEKGT